MEEYLVGHTIRNVDVLLPKIVQGDTKDIIGGKVTGVRRFGKGLVIDLDNDYCVGIHVKLTGQLVYQNQELGIKNQGKFKIIKDRYEPLPAKSTHVVFRLDKNAKLYYNDFRQFGWIKIVKSSELKDLSFFKNLGPEFPMLEKEGTLIFDQFRDIIKKSKLAVKPLIMDQKKIAGIGNIYANDGLFDAGIDPKKPANSLTDEETKQLFTSLEKVLKRGLQYGGASELSYVNAIGGEGQYQKHFLVYGRKGKPCLNNCGEKIQRITLGGRGAFFCSNCQK